MIIVLPVLSAILGILAFLPANLWFLGFFFLVPVFIFFLKEERFWRLVLGAFIFRFIFALGTVYYTLEPITWASSIGIFLGLPIVVYLLKRGLSWSLVVSRWSLVVLLPFLWTFFDLLQAQYSFLPTYIITAGNIFGSSPFLGLSAIGGLTLLTFFAATVNVLIIVFILKLKPLNPKFYILNSLIIILIILTGWQISNSQLQKNATNYNNLENSIKVAVISTNEKIDWLSFSEIKNKLVGKEMNLVVFPENVFNNIINSEKVYQDLAEELNTNLIATFGTFQNSKKYNSTVLFNNKGEIIDTYNKNRLTFAGEYWPFGGWRPFFFDWLKEKKPEIKNYAVFSPQSQYSRGKKKILEISVNQRTHQHKSDSIQFASLICLEIHYPNDLKEYKEKGARFIINPTSNRWIDIGTRHFLYLNNNLRRMEAVWLKIPIISVGVKDFAGIIKPDGKTDLVNGIFIGEINY